MKRIFSSSLILAALTVAFSGCLKDKGFDNHSYGINDPDTQPPGVGFPRGAAAKYSLGVDLSSASQTVNGLVYVNLESGNPASSDVTVTLVLNDNLRIAYNTANSTNILAMPTALFSVALSITIPAGQRNAEVPLILPNTSTLDPNNSYGIGLTIASVTGGYTIAANLKNLFIEIGLKNKYDGRYNLKATHNRSPYNYNFTTTVEMWTTGPSSVAMFWPDGGDFGQPIGTGPGAVGWYGPAVSPNFQFNPVSNLCTLVTGMPANVVTLDMVTLDAVADHNPDGPIVNRYEPGPKKMYLTFQYNGNNLRRFYDTLTYIGPR
ncbi:MAG TPA: DUF1735 domain-containing protein [Chitinophagaceae bacterium]|nr:DUF1735 domain-containing protein [Chitinophagaceae bacterium]